MAKLWQHTKNERGYALPAVLICLAVGGLLIAPTVAYAGSSLRQSLSSEVNIKGLYAADAGVEDVLWSLSNNGTPRTSLPQDLNGMQVTMSYQEQGQYTLYAGEWVSNSESSHSDYMTVASDIQWDAGAGKYKYTISVTREEEATGSIKQLEVGATLPVGYSYQAASSALFGDNLATSEPTDELNGGGAHMLKWALPSPTLSGTRTQIFYITGTGALEGYYAWAIASRSDVGTVGELSGTFYVVTATATRADNGQVAAKVVANVMKSSGAYITSWRISPS